MDTRFVHFTTRELIEELKERANHFGLRREYLDAHKDMMRAEELDWTPVEPKATARTHIVSRHNRVWEGPRRKVASFIATHEMVQIGWWYEPEKMFVPITKDAPNPTGSMIPVYCEDSD